MCPITSLKNFCLFYKAFYDSATGHVNDGTYIEHETS